MRICFLLLSFFLFAGSVFAQTQGQISTVLVRNPYKNIDWKQIHHFKTCLHAHTTNSDGALYPHQVVDAYFLAGYKILSITDHNRITYPWTAFHKINNRYENRNPIALNMLDVAGNELSGAHHTGSFIQAVPGNGANLESALQTMTQIRGLGVLKHPGRYWSPVPQAGSIYTIDWYENMYRQYPVLVGMEVFNQGDRHSKDRVLWDELLVRLMPSRPIWGHSNDDMHLPKDLFKNYSYMLMPELTMDAFRESMKQGSSYFVYEPNGSGSSRVPVIDSVVADKVSKQIRIYASDYTSIEWISGLTGTGMSRKSKVIAQGEVFSWEDFKEHYVRAVIVNAYGQVYLQPFGFEARKPFQIDEIKVIRKDCFDPVSLSIDEDESTEVYNWFFPSFAEAFGSANSNAIELDFSGYSGKVEIGVCKTNSFGSSNTQIISINVNEPLPRPVVSMEGTLLRSDIKLGNQWFNSSGPISGAIYQEYKVTESGKYYVVVSDYGCFSEPSDAFKVQLMDEKSDDKQFSLHVWPNPMSDVINVDLLNNDESFAYELYDQRGQLIMSGILTGSASLSVEHLSKGSYILKLEGQKVKKTFLLLK